MSAQPVVAVTASEFTAPCVAFARTRLLAAGYAVTVFDADGPAFERFVRAGHAAGVLDLVTGDLAGSAGASDRLTAASLVGVPQVVSLGGFDAVAVNPLGTLRRTTPEECDRLGQEVAMKACAARGPTAVVIPRRGISSLDFDGGPHWSPEANAALFQSLRNWVYGVELVELDLHVNDAEFGEACADALLRLLRVTNLSQSTTGR